MRELFLNPTMLSSVDSNFDRTPTAIKIIGGFLLFSAVCCLLCAFLPFPAFLYGLILPPAAAHIVYIGFAAVTAFAARGLLRLQESARLLTIAFLIFSCCNILLAVLPWYRRKFCLYLTQFIPYMHTLPGQPKIFFSYSMALILISCIWSLVVYGLIFWLLHRYRAAFKTPAPPPMLEA